MTKEKIVRSLRRFRATEKCLPTEEDDHNELGTFRIPDNGEGLQWLLVRSVSLIEYQNKDFETCWMLCTANNGIIKLFGMKDDREKQKFQGFSLEGLKTSDKDKFFAFDLIDNHPKTVIVKHWKVIMTILIKPEQEYMFAIDRILTALLK